MVIKLFHRHSLLVCIGLLAGVVALCMAVNFFGNQEDVPAQAPILPSSSFSDGQADSSVPEIPVEPASEDEMRAVWVPYMTGAKRPFNRNLTPLWKKQSSAG